MRLGVQAAALEKNKEKENKRRKINQPRLTSKRDSLIPEKS